MEEKQTGGMDFQLVREFVANATRVKDLDAELKAAKASLEEDKRAILDRFVEAGVGSIRIDGKTVYTHRQIWAGKADFLGPDGEPMRENGKTVKIDHAEWIHHIKVAGLEAMVRETVPTPTLSAWVRELDEDADGMPILPPELVGFVKVTEKFDVRVRNS